MTGNGRNHGRVPVLFSLPILGKLAIRRRSRGFNRYKVPPEAFLPQTAKGQQDEATETWNFIHFSIRCPLLPGGIDEINERKCWH